MDRRRDLQREYRLLDRGAYYATSARRFSGHALPGRERFERRLKSAPFAEQEVFGWNTGGWISVFEGSETSQATVRVDQILGCKPDGEGWFLTDRSSAADPAHYVYRFAEKIRVGAFQPDKNNRDIGLFQFGRAYFVTLNGRHRIAAMKGLIGPPIYVSAWVERLYSNGFRLFMQRGCPFTERWVRLENPEARSDLFMAEHAPAELMKRQTQGLWRGRITEVSVSAEQLGHGSAALRSIVWEVEWYQAPWVFAADMDFARTVYDRLPE